MFSLNVSPALTEEPMSAVLCRVAYAVAVYRYWRPVGRELPDPDHFLGCLASDLHREGFTALSSWVLSMAYYSRKGLKANQWRRCFTERARQAQRNRDAGRPWKRLPPCY